MWGGGARGFYIKLVFRNLQKAIGGGGLEGFILSSYLETFTKAVGGGTRGFYIKLLFRNLRESRRGGDSRVLY